MKRLLIVGCGDIALRALPQLAHRYEVFGLTRSAGQTAGIEQFGGMSRSGDLDDARSLQSAVAGIDIVLHLAPPGETGDLDTRTRNLVAAFEDSVPERMVYVSTSGVYGDCGGERVDEDRSLAPRTARARRRVDAENVLLEWGREKETGVTILRVPGIYAGNRLPVERIRRGTPVLNAAEDAYTNHIHAEDLAAICACALQAAGRSRVYNASDDSEMKMGDYFDLVADRAMLPRPPRISRAAAEAGAIPEALLSFMRESRRLSNARMKAELGVKLRFPSVREGLPERIEA
jgi:nucleoside-diphosphate-sugar epimerase